MDYSIIMLVAMLAIFYFLLIRPENKRKKQAEQMRNNLKKGDRITTIGGIMGRIVQVNEGSLVIETSEDRVRMELMKWAVQSTGEMEAVAAATKKSAKKDEVDEIPAPEESASEETSSDEKGE